MKNVLVMVVGLLLFAAPAFAADVDGKWTGTVSTPMGDLPVQYEFKADGSMLTGTTLGSTADRSRLRTARWTAIRSHSP